MKIYFAGSIRGGRDDQEIYFKIISELGLYGEILTEHIGNTHLTSEGEKERTDNDIYERDMAWIREADIIIAEVSTPSLGVGYELGQAESMNKPIYCLYRKTEGKRLSAMLAGNSKLQINEYSSLQDVKKIFETIFKNNAIKN